MCTAIRPKKIDCMEIGFPPPEDNQTFFFPPQASGSERPHVRRADLKANVIFGFLFFEVTLLYFMYLCPGGGTQVWFW